MRKSLPGFARQPLRVGVPKIKAADHGPFARLGWAFVDVGIGLIETDYTQEFLHGM